MSELVYARVVVDVPLLHLDRAFDYSVPLELQAQAAPGARVRVRFAGRKVLGFIQELADSAERPERVLPLIDILGPAVVTSEVFRLTRAVADRWVGALADVLRAAVPARHARAEAQVLSLLPAAPIEVPSLAEIRRELWQGYQLGDEFLDLLATEPARARAALLVRFGDEPLELALDAAQAAGGRCIVVVPDQHALERLEDLAAARLPRESWIRLSADLGPAARYRNYLRLVRGESRLVFGTRSAVFAPVSDLRLVVVVEDGDDSLAEQHAPAWHAREVSALLATQRRCAWLAVSTSRSVEVQQWVESGWAANLCAPRDAYRNQAPLIRATGDADLARDPLARSARLPAIVFGALREGLARGPVLVSVPRRGYQLHLVCDTCRQPARCDDCNGPLQRDDPQSTPYCMWCGGRVRVRSCQWCRSAGLVSVAVGAARTAEEIGRAFPGVPVIRSGRDAILRQVANEPAIVIATPGAEPVVSGGYYEAAAILDAEVVLARSDLRAEEEAFRRWQAVAHLVRPQTGRLVVAGDDSHPVIQALIRRDPIAFAQRVLQERAAAAMPPAAAVFEVLLPVGEWESTQLELPAEVRVLGPVPTTRGQERTTPAERVLLSLPRPLAADVARELRAWLGRRSAAKVAGSVTVHADPTHLA